MNKLPQVRRLIQLMPWSSNWGSPQSNRSGRGDRVFCTLWPARNSSASMSIIFKKSKRQQGANAHLSSQHPLTDSVIPHRIFLRLEKQTWAAAAICVLAFLSAPFLRCGSKCPFGVFCAHLRLTPTDCPQVKQDTPSPSSPSFGPDYELMCALRLPTFKCTATWEGEPASSQLLNSRQDPMFTENRGWAQKLPEEKLPEYLLHSKYYPLRDGQEGWSVGTSHVGLTFKGWPKVMQCLINVLQMDFQAAEVGLVLHLPPTSGPSQEKTAVSIEVSTFQSSSIAFNMSSLELIFFRDLNKVFGNLSLLVRHCGMSDRTGALESRPSLQRYYLWERDTVCERVNMTLSVWTWTN